MRGAGYMPGWIFSEDSWTSARNWTKRTLLLSDADVVPLDMKNGDLRLTADARRRGATGARWATFSKYAWFPFSLPS